MANINTDQQFAGVTLAITDSAGRPAAVDGVPVWASSDATIITVTPAADGMTALIDTVAAGVARVSVSADADLGTGITTITGVTEDITVTVGPSHAASTLTLTLPAPTAKP